MDGDSTGLTISASSEQDGHPAQYALRYRKYRMRSWMPWDNDSKPKLTVIFSPSVTIVKVTLTVYHAKKVVVKCGDMKERERVCPSDDWTPIDIELDNCVAGKLVIIVIPRGSDVICVKQLYFTILGAITGRPSISISSFEVPSVSITYHYFELDYDSRYLSISASSVKDGLLAVYALRRTPSINKYWSPWNDSRPRLCITIRGSVLVKKITMDVKNVDRIIVKCGTVTKAVVCGPTTDWTTVCIMMTNTCLAGKIIISFEASSDVNLIMVKNLFVTVATKPLSSVSKLIFISIPFTVPSISNYFELDYDSRYLSISASSVKDGLLAVYALRRTPSINKYWSPWNDSRPRLCITIRGSVLVKKITMDVKNVDRIIVKCGTVTKAVVCGPTTDWTTVCIMMTNTCLAGKIIISFEASSDVNLIMVKNLFVTVATKPCE
ncbi:hypothetical protein ScPMuIL_015571 [Solemya velum]